MDIYMKTYRVFYKTRRWTAGLLATGLAIKNGLPHLFPTYAFMPFNASLAGSQFPIEHSVWLMKSVKKDMDIKCDALAYVTNYPDVVGAGFSAFSGIKQACSVGIPKNYFCSNVFELENLNVSIGEKMNKKVECNSENEQKLMQSLLVSTQAQKFAVARAFAYFKQNWALLQAFLPSFWVAFGYVLCFHGPKILFTKSTPVSFLFILQFTIISLFATWVLCKLTKLCLTNVIENSMDNIASDISNDYAQGGVEFYRKILERNQALRTLLGKKGEKKYTAYGNVSDGLLFNWNGPTYTERIKKIEKKIKLFNLKSNLPVDV